MLQRHNRRDPCATENNAHRPACPPNVQCFSPLDGECEYEGRREEVTGETCDIICKLFEDELAFFLCQGTHRGKEETRERRHAQSYELCNS
jgi:hypothetical protein